MYFSNRLAFLPLTLGPALSNSALNRAFFSSFCRAWSLGRISTALLSGTISAPEVEDDIAGCFERPKTIDITVAGREYGPTAGIRPLREAVANLYNEHHRQDKDSKYTWENVAIVPGGRAGLIRIAAVLGNAYLSFFLPDYTAYNEMLSLFKNVSVHFDVYSS